MDNYRFGECRWCGAQTFPAVLENRYGQVVVKIEGIDLGGPVYLNWQLGYSQIWRVAGHKRFGGQGRPWVYAPAQWIAVTMNGGYASVLWAAHPGREWRDLRLYWMNKMGALLRGRSPNERLGHHE
jgi:hypothetical protein